MTTKPRTKTVDLEFPFDREGVTYSRLTLRRMRAGDALVAEGTEDEVIAGYLLMAALCDVDIEVIKMVDIEDMEKLSGAMEVMLGKRGKKAPSRGKGKTRFAGAT
ncbi:MULTISPECIES: phage tail assembly protein [Alphaproteobacteria]|uniref:phage tail assembly protein n=1 Tax=Alphaproteobacteria TaxID=28211 RepID=UPI00329644E3